MIIIEGPDLAGKTTLCEAIVEKLPCLTYTHLSKPAEDFDPYTDYRKHMGNDVICDRFHISEPIYANRDNRKCVLSPAACFKVEKQLSAFCPFVVVVNVNKATQRARWRDGEMYDLQTNMNVAEDYLELASKMGDEKFFHCKTGVYKFKVDMVLEAKFLERNFEGVVDKIVERWSYLHEGRK